MRIVLSLLILALTGGLPSAGLAQHAAPSLPAPIRESGVTLTIGAYLESSPAGGRLMLPLPLLDRLAADTALLAVDTAPVDGRVVVQVRFGFSDMASFQHWYTDERTTRLLRDVRAATMQNSTEIMISFRRGADNTALRLFETLIGPPAEGLEPGARP